MHSNVDWVLGVNVNVCECVCACVCVCVCECALWKMEAIRFSYWSECGIKGHDWLHLVLKCNNTRTICKNPRHLFHSTHMDATGGTFVWNRCGANTINIANRSRKNEREKKILRKCAHTDYQTTGKMHLLSAGIRVRVSVCCVFLHPFPSTKHRITASRCNSTCHIVVRANI